MNSFLHRGRLPAALAASAWLALAAVTDAARADVWAYVDPDGTPHFARERLDERYQLFFKGTSSLDTVPTPAKDPNIEAIKGSKLYARVATHPNVVRYAALIERNAKAQSLDPALVKAVIAVESAFEPGEISPRGAVGLMQVLPETGERYGLSHDRGRTVEQLKEPATNLRVGTRYLRDLLTRFQNDLALALAAYNAGEQSVERYGNRVPPFPETQDYVKLVQALYQFYRPPAAPAPVRPARVTIPRRATEP